MSLRVAGVGVDAGGRALLDGLDLVLHPGELCAVIGPSGAGKSTFFKVLLGLRRPDRGAVTLGGGAVGAGGAVGYVPQDDALHTALTVADTLHFAAALRLPGLGAAARAARVRAVLAAVELEDRAGLRVARLSGGQRKRLSVAVELLSEPGLLVLDEPTSGLDPALDARSVGLFGAVAAGGRVVLMSSHAMRHLGSCAALLVLVAGRQAYFGPPGAAPGWFRAPDLDGIFGRLSLRSPEAWARAAAGDPAQRAFAARPAPAPPPAPGAGPVVAPAAPAAPTPAGPRASAEAQLAALKAARGRGP